MNTPNPIGSKWTTVIVTILVAVAAQVLLFNRLYLGGWCMPMVYITALICLPVVPRWAEILLGAATGLLMDICCSSAGVHLSACVLITWLRPLLLSRMVQEYERLTDSVTASAIGTSQFVRLAVVLCLLHHLVVTGLDLWNVAEPVYMLVRWLLSSAASLAFVLIYGMIRTS